MVVSMVSDQPLPSVTSPSEMPSSKKNARPKRQVARKIVGLTSGKLLFPPMFRGKMTYMTAVTLAPAAGVTSYNTFRLNSVFDPDFSGVGSTVAGYTQAAAVYSRYRVMHFSADVEILNQGVSGLYAFCVVNPLNTVGTNFSNIMAQRNVWQKAISSKDGNGAVKHRVSGPIGVFYGVPQSQVRIEDDFAGLTSGHPSNAVYMHVGVYNPAAAAGNAVLNIRITYDVIWSLPLSLPY